jgi:16S rRNA (uracil1498-N3)-methyltransferase
MHRFYLAPEQCQGPTLELSERDAHHALHVLRLGEKARVVVLDGVGDEFLCEVLRADRREVSLKVLQKTRMNPLPYQVTLIQAVTKGKAMELIVQKATELGASRIVPILSERTVGQLDPSQALAKAQKWETLTVEAIKQCGLVWRPKVEPAATVRAFLGQGERWDMSFLASLQPEARHPRFYFEAFYSEWKRMPRSVCVWIGPEGDYTPAEINSIRAAGVLPITLGQLVLRTETAALYCLSVLNYELQSPRCD